MLVQRRLSMNVRLGVALAIMMLVSLVAYMSPASAETKTANTMKISPVRTDIEIPAGKSKTVPITITNLTKNPISVHPALNDFVAGGEDGSPALILDENEYATTHSLKRYLSPLKDVTIAAESTKTVNVRISVPRDAQAGGYFGAIRFAPTNPDGGGQVNLAPSVASLILLTVPGDTVEQLELTDFNVLQAGRPQAFFMSPEGLSTSVRFKSSGNVQVGPFGKISVKNGNDVVYATDFNTTQPRGMVLPDSARKWDIPLKNVGEFGRYTVTATFTYGKENKTIEVEKSFWVIPQYVFLIMLAALLVLIALVVFAWFYIKKRRRLSARRHSYRRR